MFGIRTVLQSTLRTTSSGRGLLFGQRELTNLQRYNIGHGHCPTTTPLLQLRSYSSSSSNSSPKDEDQTNKQSQQQNEQQQQQQQHNDSEQQQQQQQQQRRSGGGGGRQYSEELKEKNRSVGMWVAASIIAVLGLSYAAVPLYRVFCRVTGYGGTVREAVDVVQDVKKRNLEREVYPIKVSFTSSVGNKIPWTFKPTQSTIECLPGEPVLAFYRATNNTEQPIIGVATYNITPMKAGPYFTKIQCFCFDEQRIKANETIDMPVLFVIEPEVLDDKSLKGLTDITLSYTFFKSNDQGELEEI
ncbi:hypothetical protein SAMD00019534_082330 [Acytostelium subglobosum LB1]|uniref:hypothetical protein n=1 Tax=Acytostelium subglobosum LB1 TaxID=1410327 RepID=UPI000644ABF9|nr:hypothetical protein SAMD00019534_082330 [Acytostelium subglobosum LB1]GAM25058.1 hypothetical protein SAMD00019534_082330 [Acytostelium subglobosum LB1]|eukprot:XP_012752147.1 hypothetical protein SAMD00019534_082330 [Acytostelium subglobosum LB1]